MDEVRTIIDRLGDHVLGKLQSGNYSGYFRGYNEPKSKDILIVEFFTDYEEARKYFLNYALSYREKGDIAREYEITETMRVVRERLYDLNDLDPAIEDCKKQFSLEQNVSPEGAFQKNCQLINKIFTEERVREIAVMVINTDLTNGIDFEKQEYDPEFIVDEAITDYISKNYEKGLGDDIEKFCKKLYWRTNRK